jgi:hypothetical protein
MTNELRFPVRMLAFGQTREVPIACNENDDCILFGRSLLQILIE